jgi:hypothetical protein
MLESSPELSHHGILDSKSLPSLMQEPGAYLHDRAAPENHPIVFVQLKVICPKIDKALALVQTSDDLFI